MKKLVFIFLVSFSIYNCSSDDDLSIGTDDYLVFGHFYGFCGGDGCVQTYKLTDQELFKDLNGTYSDTNFDFIALDNDKFEQVKNLMDHFPSKLWDTNDDFFGCPDCADQGGLLIQFSRKGILKTWRIDQSKDNVPSYLHNFMDQVNAKIDLINN